MSESSVGKPSVPLVGLSRSSRFIPELESLRGVAVLLVFAFHVNAGVRFPFSIVLSTSPLLAFVQAGDTGVDLFFLLSGFLLSLPFLTDAAGGRRIVVRDYFARRALRILPLYWSAVVVATVLSADHVGALLRGVPYLVFLNSFAGTYTHMNPYSAVWWSLATEAQFYLLLPLLLLARSRSGRWIGAVLLCVYGVAYTALMRGKIIMGSMDGQLALHESVFGRGPLFLWGILAAVIYRQHGERIRQRLAGIPWARNGAADALLLALLTALALFLQWLVSIGPMRQMGAPDQYWHVVNGGLWAGILLLVLLAPLRTKPLFSNPVLSRLGILSYSIYMIHSPLVFLSLRAIRTAHPRTFEGWRPSTAGVVALLTVACFALSSLTYRFIERPFLVRKARFDS